MYSLRWLVAGLSPRRSGFDPRPFHVRVMADRMVLWQVLLPARPIFSCHYHSTSAPYSSATRCCYQEEEEAKHCFGSRNAVGRKVLSIFSEGLSDWSPGCHGGASGSMPAKSVCDCSEQSGTGTGFLRVLRFTPITIIPPILLIHFHLHATFTRRTKGRRTLETKKSLVFR